jgi:hypothetical protein
MKHACSTARFTMDQAFSSNGPAAANSPEVIRVLDTHVYETPKGGTKVKRRMRQENGDRSVRCSACLAHFNNRLAEMRRQAEAAVAA